MNWVLVDRFYSQFSNLLTERMCACPRAWPGMIQLGLQSIAKSLWFGTIKFSLQYTVLTFSAPPGKVTSKCNCAQVIADHARYPARTRVLDFASGVCSHSELE